MTWLSHFRTLRYRPYKRVNQGNRVEIIKLSFFQRTMKAALWRTHKPIGAVPDIPVQ